MTRKDTETLGPGRTLALPFAERLRTANVAVTARSVVIETRHVALLPVQAPDQPVKTEPEVARAVSVTVLP